MTYPTDNAAHVVPNEVNRSKGVPASVTKLIIEPGMTAKNYWRDLWHYRELLYFLAWRDIAVRYKQTVVGIVWALIRPALIMLVFVGFRRFVGPPAGAVAGSVLVFAA